MAEVFWRAFRGGGLPGRGDQARLAAAQPDLGRSTCSVTGAYRPALRTSFSRRFGLDGLHYLVLEYVDGPSLALVLRVLRDQGRLLSISEAAHVTVEVARALDYAHRKKGKDGTPLGIVHRDVSASNVLISVEGEVKLADFGIARARSRVSSATTGSGVFKGKLSYAAPEAVRSGRVDAQSDLFSLGVVAYEMLTGLRPFSGDTEAEVIGKLLFEPAPPPSVHRPEVPESFDTVVAALLESDPSRRPAHQMWSTRSALSHRRPGPGRHSRAPWGRHASTRERPRRVRRSAPACARGRAVSTQRAALR
jgi:serine/threonine protein kinase